MPIWAVCKFASVPIQALTLPQLGTSIAHVDMNEAVAKAIASERAIAGITIKALSERTGIPERSLIRVLQSEREIKVNQVAQIANGLRIYPHELIETAENIMERENSRKLRSAD